MPIVRCTKTVRFASAMKEDHVL